MVKGPCTLRVDGEPVAEGVGSFEPKLPERYITLKLPPELVARFAEGRMDDIRITLTCEGCRAVRTSRYLWDRCQGCGDSARPGKKEMRRIVRAIKAHSIEDQVAADLRRMATEDEAALQRALGMAQHDLLVTKGRHPAARRFLEIARREGIA
jgi:hypothetical protein